MNIQYYICYFQEDLDGNLFNLLDFFPSKQCSSLLGGLNSCFESLSVIGDEGKVQSVISSLLSLLQGSSFYVNAKKGSGENIFKYGESDNSEEELYHLALQNLEKEEEQCLTFSLDDSGNLVSSGVDCQTKLKPLCLQITPDNLDFIDDKCQEYNPYIYPRKVDLRIKQTNVKSQWRKMLRSKKRKGRQLLRQEPGPPVEMCATAGK